MLDIQLLRSEPESIRANYRRRNNPDLLARLDEAIALDAAWRDALKDVESARAERNRLAKAVAEKKKAQAPEAEVAKALAESKATNARVDELQKTVDEKRAATDRFLMRLPNLLHESVPEGKDDTDNAVVRTWGEPRTFGFDLKSHGELAEAAGLADFDRAAKVAGAGFVFLKGELALLDLAIQRVALDLLVERGFTPVATPVMMRRGPYEGVTDLADFESVMYKVDGDDLYLIATSEHPIGAMHMDEVIDEEALPLRYAGVSPCFRREIGARGVDTKGLFRMHQFNKVEQFVFCAPEDSWTIHEELLENAEAVFQALEVPYRVVNVCTGDIGTVAAKKYDIEAWSPRQGNYAEVVSCSNCTDYQARRLRIRAGKHGGEKRVLHTLNSTAVATSRALVVLLENHQNEDGSVTLPKALRPYMGGAQRIADAMR